eukprot:TRINITY_DN64849_c0_g1_i1.p1 TRINITY_DN64849_c0_g1~~TRINITY_DN64849_c0_g1_i1.p1  ORF type:complete len:370 (-),score=89.89 TRINITY_DN64849_c0_g1_i1:172-1281(-)
MAGKGGAEEERLFVTKIPPQVTKEDVAEHFAQFGTTTDVYLPSVPGRGGHKGIAFISFAEPAAVQTAFANSPHHVRGHEVVVDVAAPRGSAPPGGGHEKGGYTPPPPREETNRVFVTKIPPQVMRDDLTRYFQQFGELSDVYMPAVPGSAVHKGICFVSYADAVAVQTCLAQPAHEIGGFPVVVDVATPRGPEGKGGKGGPPSWNQDKGMGKGGKYGGFGYSAAPSYHAPSPGPGAPVPGRLFLTKVSPDITKGDLQLYFEQFGQLDDVYVPFGKGIAFVSFVDPNSTRRCLELQQHFVKPGVSVVVDQAFDRPSKGGGKDGYGGKGLGPPPAFVGGYKGGGYDKGYDKGGFGGWKGGKGGYDNRYAPF